MKEKRCTITVCLFLFNAMLNHIRNIIFDLGGVIINLDYNRTSEAFKKMGLTDFERIYTQVRQEKLFDRFETGTVSENSFREEIIKHLPAGTSHEEVDEAWNAMLLEFPEDRLDFIYALKRHYRIFLLSNTNLIHMRAFLPMAEKIYGLRRFNDAFDKIYYSCQVGLRKPDTEIFELVLQENNLEPGETLFIDDSPQHIEGAKAAGIHAELLLPNETIEGKYAGLLLSA